MADTHASFCRSCKNQRCRGPMFHELRFNRKRRRQFCFKLTVLAAQSPGTDPRTTYSQTCFTQQACTLMCPDVNTPAPNTPNLTANGIVWHKVFQFDRPNTNTHELLSAFDPTGAQESIFRLVGGRVVSTALHFQRGGEGRRRLHLHQVLPLPRPDV